MRTSIRVLGGASILLAPLAFGISDQLRMRAEPPEDRGLTSEFGVTEAAATFASIEANLGLFVAASFLAYVGMLLTIPALLAIWWLSAERAPRWAWAGAVLAVLFVVGEVAHLAGYNAMSIVVAPYHDEAAVMEMWVSAGTSPLVIALFVPYVVGLLAAIPQAIGLRRARVIPLWAAIAVIAGTSIFLAFPWLTALWMLLVVGGFAPAAIAMMTGSAISTSPRGVRPASA
jgi:hypothetical protein